MGWPWVGGSASLLDETWASLLEVVSVAGLEERSARKKESM